MSNIGRSYSSLNQALNAGSNLVYRISCIVAKCLLNNVEMMKIIKMNNILRSIGYISLPSNFFDTFKIVKRYIYRKTRDALIFERNNKVIQGLLENGNKINLELGAGGRKMDGWTSIDFGKDSDIVMDLSSPLPFPDNTVTQIYASHLLEHFYYPDLMHLIYECYRVLKPGGILTVAVPNARIYLDAYQNPEKFDSNYYCRWKPGFHYNTKMDYVNYIAYMGGHHRYMFDEENLLLILSKPGFESVKIREFDPALDLEQRSYESIYAEATK
jgi:predicted SAM-dependent methyltransferase